MNGLARAIKVSGTQANLAESLRHLSGKPVKQQHISSWLKSRVPAEWCPLIFQATGVPASELRPDVFSAMPDIKQSTDLHIRQEVS